MYRISILLYIYIYFYANMSTNTVKGPSREKGIYY